MAKGVTRALQAACFVLSVAVIATYYSSFISEGSAHYSKGSMLGRRQVIHRVTPGSYGNGGGRPSGPSTGGPPSPQELKKRRSILTAHAVLASLAFVIIFPLGGILIRLASFPGLLWVHVAIQALAYLIYTAAFGLGIYMTHQIPGRQISNFHPIIGIVVFILLFTQPITGYWHHLLYKRTGRRNYMSYPHLWLGRTTITLGIINGGLGLFLARRLGYFVPNKSQIVAYAVIAALMWSAYVASAILGEVRRRRHRVMAPLSSTDAHQDIPPDSPQFTQMRTRT